MQTNKNSIPLVKICGAKSKRTGKPCQNKSMPNGKCRLHGGKTPVKHGLYSKSAPVFLRDRMEEYLNDPRVADITEQLALAVSLIDELMKQLNNNGELNNETRFILHKFIDLVTKILERKNKIEATNSLTIEQVRVLIRQVAFIVNKHVRDEKAKTLIAEDLKRLALRN